MATIEPSTMSHRHCHVPSSASITHPGVVVRTRLPEADWESGMTRVIHSVVTLLNSLVTLPPTDKCGDQTNDEGRIQPDQQMNLCHKGKCNGFRHQRQSDCKTGQ